VSHWKDPLFVGIALGGSGLALALATGVAAVLTRPVSPEHAAALRATARGVAESLERGTFAAYGEGSYGRKQSFHAHYRDLGKALDRWDALLTAAEDEDRTHASNLPLTQAVVHTDQQLEIFKQTERPSLLNDLQLIQQDKRPPIAPNCEACLSHGTARFSWLRSEAPSRVRRSRVRSPRR
jgi:hypothetical protein